LLVDRDWYLERVGNLQNVELSMSQLRERPGWKWHRYPDDVVPAWIAEMDFLPAEPIRARLVELAELGQYGYEDDAIYAALKREFAAYMRRRFGWAAASEPILPLGDLVQALNASVMAFAGPGEGVVLQTPIYPPFLNAVYETGRRFVEHRLRDDGARLALDRSDLAAVVDANTRLLLVCNPHNPTGRAFDRTELEALAEIALERDLTVVVDEVHADLVYPGRTHVPFAMLGAEVAARTVTITSATKAYNIPGLRCGLMHFGSEELRERFRRALPDRLFGKANLFGVEATLAAWRYGQPWLEDVVLRLQANRDRLADVVAHELPGVRHHPPEATYLAWLNCNALDLPGSPQAYFLEHGRVGLADGADFGPPGAGCVRLNFGTSSAILDELLQRLVQALPRHAAARRR
jgi:cystathionine beta-lyase